MRKLFVCMSSGLLISSLTSAVLPIRASVTPEISSHKFSNVIAATDQSALIKKNKNLLLTNRTLARKIATKLGIVSAGEVPTSGTPLEQNEVLILQNQETFKEIAIKVGAKVPALTAVTAADQAEKNHQLLLQNRSIVVEILKKLSIPAAAPAALTGTFVDKNHTLLVGNGKALAKIAAKLGV